MKTTKEMLCCSYRHVSYTLVALTLLEFPWLKVLDHEVQSKH